MFYVSGSSGEQTTRALTDEEAAAWQRRCEETGEECRRIWAFAGWIWRNPTWPTEPLIYADHLPSGTDPAFAAPTVEAQGQRSAA